MAASGGPSGGGVFVVSSMERETTDALSGVAARRATAATFSSCLAAQAALFRADWALNRSFLQTTAFPIAATCFLRRGVRRFAGGRSSRLSGTCGGAGSASPSPRDFLRQAGHRQAAAQECVWRVPVRWRCRFLVGKLSFAYQKRRCLGTYLFTCSRGPARSYSRRPGLESFGLKALTSS
jgi:hypothetical protein